LSQSAPTDPYIPAQHDDAVRRGPSGAEVERHVATYITTPLLEAKTFFTLMAREIEAPGVGQ
jgi:hypothetical protein